ncbi:MAG TPA: TIGR02206 family membrane protein, partial [Mycobacterium sp.]|nr:TIGR02206 family membrane protein [Mycobacterium sp.]
MLAKQFSAYGPSHWATIALFVIGAAALVWVGHRQTEQQARRLGRLLGAITAVIYAAILVYVLTPP